MNRKQQAVILVAFLAILWMGVYPPWKLQRHLEGGPSWNVSQYGWVFDPPAAPVRMGARFFWEVRVDLERLVLQWALVVIAVVPVCWLLKSRKRPERDRWSNLGGDL